MRLKAGWPAFTVSPTLTNLFATIPSKGGFEGVVEEISPASAATFALVPRDISAGEFTKVVQRIPVKIRIKKGNLSLLRVGMGGRVEIKRE